MQRLIVLGCFALALTALAPSAGAGEIGFSVGRDLGVIEFTGARDFANIGTRVGYRAGRLFPFVTADYARYSIERDFDSRDFSTIASNGYLLTLGAGARYLFGEPEADTVVPYAVGAGVTVIPSYSSTETTDPEVHDATSLGFQAGGGADYYFGDSFSVGGEVGVSGLFMTFSDTEKTVRVSAAQIYSGIQLTFLF